MGQPMIRNEKKRDKKVDKQRMIRENEKERNKLGPFSHLQF
jgi:hypothetical protein